MDDLDLAAVAARLGKSRRWLQAKLADDRRKIHPRLQHHYLIGRSPRWDEAAYQRLKMALAELPMPVVEENGPRDRQVSPSLNAMGIGISMAASGSKDAQSAFERVQNFQRTSTRGITRRK